MTLEEKMETVAEGLEFMSGALSMLILWLTAPIWYVPFKVRRARIDAAAEKEVKDFLERVNQKED